MQKIQLKSLVPLIIFISMAILLGVGLTLNPRELPSTLINKPAPEFTLAKLSDQNSVISPKQLLGKKWLLNVWASWCVSCKVEHPLLNQLANQSNIIMVGLNYKDTIEGATTWLEQRGNPYNYVALDLKGDAGIDWGVYGVPETFVINEQGLIIYKHSGPLDPNIINNEILPLFAL